MAATGISPENGATTTTPEETCNKQMAVQKSAETYLLADAGKFRVVSLLTFCRTEDFTGIITDRLPDPDFCQYAREHQVRMIVAE